MTDKIKLLSNHIEYLESFPEQGMGYQIVDIILKDGRTLSELLVFNSTYLKSEEQINPEDIKEIRIHW